uniref:PZP alpha-2-macroglobulin like n=1 Tax=Marmota marmota marmota TaxID=9994 RepID=A0A8C5ZWJ1_MARMA
REGKSYGNGRRPSIHYMVLVPSLLHTVTPEKACLLLSHLNETVTISASLESLRENRSLFTDLVVEKDLFHCISFTVSTTRVLAVGFLTIQIKGPTQDFRKKNTVLVKNAQSLVFVQTDKPIYKPGQTVRFRIVSLDENFHPQNELNPKRNRIAQWQSLKLESGLSQLSFPLSSEPIQGSYKVVVQKESGGTAEHSFTVEEFGMDNIMGNAGGLSQFLICFSRDRYTYGKPVPGLATVSMCRKLFHHGNCYKKEFCDEFSQPLNSDGCITQQIKTNLIQIKSSGYEMKLRVEAKIREEGTDLIFTGNGTSEITNIATKLKFVKCNSQVIHQQPNTCFNYIWIQEEHQGAQHTASHVFSLSGSYLYLEPVAGTLPCGQTQNIKAHYILDGQAMGKLKELILYYLIMAKGSIVRSGTHALSVESGDMKGSFFLSLSVELDIAPIARVFLFTILPDGEVIGDSENFEIENCLANKVDLSFSPAQTLPASHAHLRITASPQSLCAIRAVDQSVLLMRPEAELSASSVSASQSSGISKDREKGSEQEKPLLKVKCDNKVIIFSQGMGLKVFTNSKIRKISSCSVTHTPTREVPFCAFHFSNSVPNMESSTHTAHTCAPLSDFFLHSSFTLIDSYLRKYVSSAYFLFFTLCPISSSGMAEVEKTVPDTITEWKAGALCLSNDTGLGLSPTASLRVFQPFFVELTMPYSVVRGEAFTLKATVLNYLPKCIRLEASPTFLASPNEKAEESYCICGNERQILSWTVTPKTLGNVNFSVSTEVMKSLELCGNEVTEVPETGRKDTIIKTLLCPDFKSFYSPGDILGSTMQNIQNLLQMPYGCGEQNMVLFAPNIYILNYLNETQQLTQEIKSKAIGYLIGGYQRQLNYKHQDGSYSTFGEQYGRNQGNTWLTAFVLKTFAQARAYIFIDEAHITQALTWLSQKQKDNGCFRSSGSLLNNAIKGGVEDEVTLSAYVTIALLEIPLPATHPVVRNALFCLESAWNRAKEGAHGSHVYTRALLAYAFALVGNQNRSREILRSLNEEAVKEDNSVHWERPQKPRAPQGLLYQPQAPSAEVEMTAYVLLTLLTVQPAPTSEDLTSAVPIVKWITKQQNSHGGFSSTQDTVVALHALSRYGAATFTKTEKTAQVTIQNSRAFSTNFQVDNNNPLLLQQISLPELPGDYTITITGERCVYLQTSMKYNIHPKKEDSPFSLKVQTLPEICDGPKAHTSFQISLNISYTGSRPVSNMVIADIKMISGFIPLKPTVKMLERSSYVSRTEVSNNHVLIYVDQVTNQTLSFSFTVLQDIPVRDLKPATVKVYDYYETDEFSIAEYISPCSTGKKSHFMTIFIFCKPCLLIFP